ncbi:MAG: AAA family ATPase [Sandaracinaceae bacterium]
MDVDLRPSRWRPFQHLVLLGRAGSGKTALLTAAAEELEANAEGRRHPAAGHGAFPRDPAGRAAWEQRVRLAHLGRPLRLHWSATPSSTAESAREGRLVLAAPPWPLDDPFTGPPRRGVDGPAAFPPPVRATVAYRYPEALLRRRREAAMVTDKTPYRTFLRGQETILGVLLADAATRLSVQPEGVTLHTGDGRRVRLGELSTGQRLAVALYAELFVRHEEVRRRGHDPDHAPAAVMILDGAEVGLDARLQRELLPTLAQTFPRLQLLVSTHSPLTALCLDDAIVYDLRLRRGRPVEEVRADGIEELIVAMSDLRRPSSLAPARGRGAGPPSLAPARLRGSTATPSATAPPPPGPGARASMPARRASDTTAVLPTGRSGAPSGGPSAGPAAPSIPPPPPVPIVVEGSSGAASRPPSAAEDGPSIPPPPGRGLSRSASPRPRTEPTTRIATERGGAPRAPASGRKAQKRQRGTVKGAGPRADRE